MLETPTAITNAEEIAAVPGVDVLRNGVAAPTSKRFDVILPIARASTARFAGRGTGMFSLEFPFYCT
jgi:hypothetical protein